MCASRVGRAITETVFVKLSMMARASVSPVSDGLTLALEIHGVARAGFRGVMAGEHAVGQSSFGALVFTNFAILQETAHVSFHGGPMVVASE